MAATPPTLSELQSQVDLLTDLAQRVSAIRSFPARLLNSSAITKNALGGPPSLNATSNGVLAAFEELRAFDEELKTERAQDALNAAAKSEKLDGTSLGVDARRATRKRLQPPEPSEPPPAKRITRAGPSLLCPPLLPDVPPGPVDASTLIDYVRSKPSLNAREGYPTPKVHIWAPVRNRLNARLPMVLRISLPRVLVAFITLNKNEDEDTKPAPLIIENVTVFGAMEQKAPHAQSEYIVFQRITQQISKMILLQPTCSLPSMLDLLASYSDLFTAPCTGCSRMLSEEGHLPPVGRLWLDNSDPTLKGWTPRHVSCMRN